jgi:hypothetical protein
MDEDPKSRDGGGLDSVAVHWMWVEILAPTC